MDPIWVPKHIMTIHDNPNGAVVTANPFFWLSESSPTFDKTRCLDQFHNHETGTKHTPVGDDDDGTVRR